MESCKPQFNPSTAWIEWGAYLYAHSGNKCKTKMNRWTIIDRCISLKRAR